MSNLPIIETINTNIANLKNTKQNIKNAVNTDYDFINNEQIESYPDLIKQGIAYYKNRVLHATKEGTDLSFNAVPLKFENMTIKGNTEQASTSIASGDEYDSPSPEHPQPIHVVTGNNTVEVQGKNLSNVSFPTNNMLVTENSLLPGTYTMSWQSESTTGFNLRKNIQSGDIIVSNVSTSPVTFVLNETCKVFLNGWKNINQMANIQIEQGSTATDYEPYSEPRSYPLNLGSIELCKIGDYQDYLYKENGNWYIQKNTKKAILGKPTTGNLTTDYTYNYFSYRGEPSEIYPGTNIICSHFIGAYNITDMRTQAQYNNSVYLGSGGTFVRVDKFNTVEEYINALSANDITIIGRARTPTTTQITDTTLLSQLNALDKAKGNNGTTIITTSGDELVPILNFTAYLKEVE